MVITTGISAAAIGGVIGAIGSAAVMIIKAAHGRNQNKKDQYDYSLNLVRIVQNQNECFDKMNYELGKINGTIDAIKEDIRNFNEKLDKMENQRGNQ